jgi:hypothetical protein
MLLNDGIVTICTLENISIPGKMPKEALKKQFREFYGVKTAGVTRYYAGKQAGDLIELLIEIQRRDISPTGFYAVIGDSQYRISQVQQIESDGLKMTDLSLVRLGENYDVA